MMMAAGQTPLNALVEPDNAANSMQMANPKPDLAALGTHIDELAKQLPRGTNPTLLHYLQKKSNEKAQLCLTGRDADNPGGTAGMLIS
jgi:hypothetical protein